MDQLEKWQTEISEALDASAITHDRTILESRFAKCQDSLFVSDPSRIHLEVWLSQPELEGSSIAPDHQVK
jgi:hypothetical protein